MRAGQPSPPSPRRNHPIGTALGLVAVAALTLATAFFVGAEFAVVAVERSRLEAMADQGDRRARVALALHRRLSFHLSGAQLGLTIVSLVFGFVAEPTLARVLDPLLRWLPGEAERAVSLGASLAVATVLSMVGGELIPKNLVLADPERAALWLAAPLRAFDIVLGPFIRLANGSANRLVRAFGVEPQEELTGVRSVEELAWLIRRSGEAGALKEDKAALLERSIRFATKTAADALVARTQVATVAADATLATLVQRALETGHSRFPVIGIDLDDVVAVVHVKDVYRVARASWPATPVRAIAGEPLAVPETLPLQDLFDRIRAAQAHLAIVVDEHGGTAGVVTLEDILEELVGEIDDEYDVPTTLARFERDSGCWVLAGTLHGDEVREACGFDMPEGEFDTLAGFMLDRLGRIPTVGDAVDVDGWRLDVAAMDRLRIASVRAIRREAAPARGPTSPGPPP